MTNTNTGGDAEGDDISNIQNVIGSAGADSITGDANANEIDGGADNDTIEGGAGNNVLIGGAGDDSITGGTNNDSITGGAGADIIDGGGSIDTVIYDGAAVTVNLTTNVNTGGDAAGDDISNVENITGTDGGDDSLTGDVNDNIISGRGGNDSLEGGLGNDVLTGGTGDDVFVFASATSGNDDNITDFTTGNNTIELEDDNFVFAAGDGAKDGVSLIDDVDIFNTSGFGGGNFTFGTGTTFLYDEVDGEIWYDSDGAAGGGTAVLIATIDDFALYTYDADDFVGCLLYTSPSPRDQRGSRMPSSA